MHALASHIAFQYYHLRPLQPITRKVNFNKNNDIAQKHAHHTCYNTGTHMQWFNRKAQNIPCPSQLHNNKRH